MVWFEAQWKGWNLESDSECSRSFKLLKKIKLQRKKEILSHERAQNSVCGYVKKSQNLVQFVLARELENTLYY